MACRSEFLWLKMACVLSASTAFAGCVLSHEVEGVVSSASDGSGGTARSGGSGTGNAGTPCAPSACQPSALGFGACCTADTDVCGLVANKVFAGAGCLEADAPGRIDSTCPAGNLTISGTAVSAQGCCQGDGTCGLMDTVAGLGCTSDPNKPKGASCVAPVSRTPVGGNGGNGGTGGTSTNVSTCDPAACQGSTLGLTTCCTDTDLCGYDGDVFFPGAGCLEANAPGSSDASCPSSTVTVMGFTVDLPGCCRADGTCGVMDSFAGLGCTLSPDTPMGAPCAGPI